MRFGYNVLSIPDTAEFGRHLNALQPGGMLFFQNNIDNALAVKRTFPDCHVVMRLWPDHDTPQKYPNPADWVASVSNFIGTGIIVQTQNEGGFSVGWHLALLKYLSENKINLKVGILGLNVGTPLPEQWEQAEDLLRLASSMRGQVYIVLHEYFGGIITSGFLGGWPNNAGVAPGQPGGQDFLTRWPNDPSKMTKWHVGRYEFLRNFCISKGFRCPQIIIGEFGADYTSDIGEFLRTIQSSKGPYDIVDGWRDLTTFWAQLFPKQSAAETYVAQIEYADSRIYDENVVAVLLFAYGTDGNWNTYRTDPELSRPLELYAAYRHDQPPPVPPPIALPSTTQWVKAEHRHSWSVNVREHPSQYSKVVDTIRIRSVYYWIDTPKPSNGWVVVVLPSGKVGYAWKKALL